MLNVVGDARGTCMIYSWKIGQKSPFEGCGLNVLKALKDLEVSANGAELEYLCKHMHNIPMCIPPRNNQMKWFGEMALFIAFNFPYDQKT